MSVPASAQDAAWVDAVLDFWFGPVSGARREEWFAKDPAFDAEIRDRFGDLYARAAAGACDDAAATPRGRLALVIVLDQFPRNMFRDDSRAFAADAHALIHARAAVAAGQDAVLAPIEREFLYMPFQHSESLADQRRSVALFADLGDVADDYARRHLAIIERFGRFPHRNAVLGRDSTPEERTFLTRPGSSF